MKMWLLENQTHPFHLFKENSILKNSVLELLAHPVRLLTWLLYRFENTEIAFTHASKNFYPLELEGVPPLLIVSNMCQFLSFTSINHSHG